MRLINTATGAFEEFIGNKIPKYAILSHTWGDDEVTFQDMKDPSSHQKKGFRKISKTCELAAAAGLRYAWVDTCCIDKSSSAELTEAINSMYRWYQRAEVCYAWLSDLPTVTARGTVPFLESCRWFSRGWTLQELLAPRDVVFFDKDWNEVGSKWNLALELSKITGIPPGILNHSDPLSSLCVARRMSWAASRETTRIEDAAYCLLGIFEVNMPLLYGEEENAFRRLQEEIIKSSDDLSIFAWTLPRPPSTSTPTSGPPARIFRGVMAPSPAAFSKCGALHPATAFSQGPPDFSLANSCIKIQCRLFTQQRSDGRYCHYVLPVNCTRDATEPSVLGILLRKCGPDQFVREEPWTLEDDVDTLPEGRSRPIYLLTKLPKALENIPQDLDMSHGLGGMREGVLQVSVSTPNILYRCDVWPPGDFDEDDQVFIDYEYTGKVAAVRFKTAQSQPAVGVWVDVMLYATAGVDRRWKFSMVDYRTHANTCNDINSRIDGGWGISTRQLEAELASVGIWHGSATGIVLDGVAGRPKTAVSCRNTRVKNSRICRHNFLRVEVSYAVV